MIAGASQNEVALVVLLLVIVMLTPKIGKLGEAFGRLFDKSTRIKGDSEQEQDR